MGKDKRGTDSSKAAQGAKLTITAKITLPDGSEVTRVIEAEDGIPSPDQIDVSTTKENFLRSFEVLEKSILEVRNRTGEAIIDMMADEIKKEVLHTNAVTPASCEEPYFLLCLNNQSLTAAIL